MEERGAPARCVGAGEDRVLPMKRHPDIAAAITALALLLVLAPGAARGSWLAAADSLYAIAREHHDARDYASAARYYAETVLHIEGGEPAARSPYTQQMLAHARFLMGRCHERLEEWRPAIGAYSASMVELPQVSDLVWLRLAHCHREVGEFDEAVESYRRVVDGERTILYLEAVEALGDCYRDEGNLDVALQWYRVFLSEADGYDDRARGHYKIGLLYKDRGEHAAAEESFADAVDGFPRSRFAYDALKEGRSLSRAFTDRYHQGLTLYNRREYRTATEYFTYYLRHNDEREWAADATYFLGRCHQRRGHFRTAANKYRDAIEMGVEGEYYDLAWRRLAYCLRVVDRLGESLAVYDEYVERHPDREAAAEILWEKARLLEEKQRWSEAAEAFRDLEERYPESGPAPDALFRAGLCLFKLESYGEADAWFADLFLDGEGEEAARALFWAGKSSEALGRLEEAALRYREAGDADRDSFYGRRALDRLAALGAGSDAPRASGPPRASGNPRGRIVGGTGEFHGFAVWLGKWHRELYVPAGRIALREELASRTHYVRGETFLAVRMRDLAEEEFGLLEANLDGDPRFLDILSSLYERAGLHMRAVRLAERILALSPAEGLSDAPIYLRKKICPVHFDDVVLPACAEKGIDPNLFFSLIRQESLFESDAVSWVGARGLSQIMPATGRWIAGKLGVRPYDTRRLLDPATNVRFGTYYLSLQIEEFEGDTMRALAAYNGGPESAKRWWGYGGGRDTDVFVEDIGYEQTADYVRRVYLYAEFYRDAYGE
jgi:soluble lytic murein transglycosylase